MSCSDKIPYSFIAPCVPRVNKYAGAIIDKSGNPHFYESKEQIPGILRSLGLLIEAPDEDYESAYGLPERYKTVRI